jgi:aldehyde:ferredoxin oxidoreductase
MKGNTGTILRVDLNSGDIHRETIPEEWYLKYIGGSGLAAKYFWERGDFDAGATDPEAMLMIMNGPMAGLKMSGASRFSIAGRSPLTGHWGDSSCGGYFAPELRYAGYDGIVVSGRAEKPCLLLVEDANARLLDATEYWGLGIDTVHRELKARFGPGYRDLIIGPAGENRVGFAAIISENHHTFGRAGFGAVMGSKNLKAVVAKASNRKMAMVDPEGFKRVRREINLKLKESITADVLRQHGTAANLEGSMFKGDVPIRNFTSNFNEEMGGTLTGDALTAKYLTKKHACAFCSVGCKRIIEIKEGPFHISEGPGPEYETIVSFGSLMDSSDLAAACKAGRVCNDLGMDTISAGSTIAWAMEAFEQGDLTLQDTGGVPLNWADLATVIDVVLPMIARREGRLGALLADGSARAAATIGKGMDYTTHSKGMEAPMHDPRGGGHGLALTYAVSPRGACHVADPMLFMEMGACYWPEIGFEYELMPCTDENKPEAAVVSVAMGGIENSACICNFVDGDFSIPNWVDLFNTVAGYNWTASDMMTAGRRVFFIKRLINHKYGLTADDDRLTPRLLEPARDGEPEGIKIEFDAMKSKFYSLIGFDETLGIPGPESLVSADMKEEAQAVWTQNL